MTGNKNCCFSARLSRSSADTSKSVADGVMQLRQTSANLVGVDLREEVTVVWAKEVNMLPVEI